MAATKWLLPGHASGRVVPPQLQAMPTFSVHRPASFAFRSPVDVGIEGLRGEVESSCSHPREAMNLIRVRRISRKTRTGRRRKVYSMLIGGGGVEGRAEKVCTKFQIVRGIFGFLIGVGSEVGCFSRRESVNISTDTKPAKYA